MGRYNFIGASSDSLLSNRDFFDKWCYLPYINDSKFIELLQTLLKQYNIKKIYASSSSVWYYFKKFIEDDLIELSVINEVVYEPSFEYINYFKRYSSRLYKEYLSTIDIKKAMRYSEFASALHYYHQICGESGDSKFIALMQIGQNTPKGDIVEIGTQQGKSALALIALSKKYDIGNVLCIDPWMEFVQYDSPDVIQNMSKNIDVDRVFDSFIINLSFLSENINYIKKSSDDAYVDYKQNSTIYSDEFGKIEFKQKIAILHIDGNHDYDYVYRDLKNYSQFLVDYSWIVLDDYIWAYGDGPKIVGDDFLKYNSLNINSSFYTDGTLFIQIKDAKKIVIR